LRIEEHYGGELAGLFEQFGAVVDGTVDIGHIYPTTQPNTFPMEQISLLHSFNVETLADSQMYTELMADFPEMQQAYTDAGLKLLFKIASFPSYFGTMPGKEIRTFDDLNGKKWLSTGPWDSANWEAMGMTPVQIMPQETYTSVQTGLLDGICTTLDFLYDFGVQDLVTKITNVHIRPASWSCAMNLDVWNSLPKEFQDAIMAEAAEAPMIRDQMELRIDVELRAKLAAEEGTEFIDLPQADQDMMQEVTEGVRQEFVDLMNSMGLPGQELLERNLELEKKYAGQEYALKE
jgi:TRAP-type C4-dicarboxylate transport system substrate-binding protein